MRSESGIVVETVKWVFPLGTLNSSSDGGTMNKLFRAGELSDTALLAREAVQNSSDAARRFGQSHPEAQYRAVFRFVDFVGDEKAAMVEALDLEGLGTWRKRYKKDPAPGSALDSLNDLRKPLRLLYVEDYGTHGLFGNPEHFMESHLFMALYYVGVSTKPADDGGQYGFGKSALERAGRTHSVIAHSAFEEQADDPGVTSRLIGFTWWSNTQEGKAMYEGRGRFSDPSANSQGDVPVPFANGVADEIAQILGFPKRDASKLDELGTSFLVIDPSIEPAALVRQLEMWWWPALEEHKLDVQVISPDGEVLTPKPAANPFVAQFLKPYRIATGLDTPGDANLERLASRLWRDRSGRGGADLGRLGLTVVEDGVAEGVDMENSSSPLVAFMRGPRMVIRYEKYQRKHVPIRGVFVASDRINGLLKETEPSSHDMWSTNPSSDIPEEATLTAKDVQEKIRRSVNEFARDTTPPPPKTNKALGEFSKLMSGIVGTKRGGGPNPPRGGEPISIKYPAGRPAPVVVNEDEVTLTTIIAVKVAADAPGSACSSRISCSMFVLEDEAKSKTQVKVSIRPIGTDHGLEKQGDGSWTGAITKDRDVRFKVSSEPYPNIWTVALQPTVERLTEWSDK